MRERNPRGASSPGGGQIVLRDREELGPRFPTVRVKLVAYDGDVFAIIGAVSRVLRSALWTPPTSSDSW
jgi:hypothetical protein